MVDKHIPVRRLVWDKTIQRYTAGNEAIQQMIIVEQLGREASRPAERYLKGPVPWSWIVASACLPAKALIIGLCIWRLAGSKRSRTVVLGNQDLQPFAIDRAAKSRALTTLERAGLIDVVGRPGRLPTITLLDTTGLEVAAAKGGRTASQRGGLFGAVAGRDETPRTRSGAVPTEPGIRKGARTRG